MKSYDIKTLGKKGRLWRLGTLIGLLSLALLITVGLLTACPEDSEIRALLEPEGLWYQVLALNRSRLEQLISDETVAQSVREKLEALRQVVATSPHLWVRRLLPEE